MISNQLIFPKRICSCGRQDGAIDSCPQCNIPKGWQCPVCFKVCSPDTKECDHVPQYCAPPKTSIIYSAGTDVANITDVFTGIMTVKHTNGLTEMIRY